MTYAIIQLSGKQYLIKQGDTLQVEKLAVNENKEIEINEVLLTFEDKGEKIVIGAPFIEKAIVTAKILEHGKRKKVTVVKFKPKIRYKKTRGHRQEYTKVEIVKIA